MQNMWQIPTEEINRPGNFSTHARRNLDLLLEVLTRLSDVQSLSYLAQHLKSKPDTTKQYMRDNERAFIFKKVRTYMYSTWIGELHVLVNYMYYA